MPLTLTAEQMEKLQKTVAVTLTRLAVDGHLKPTIVPLLLTKEQAARILGVSVRTVSRMVVCGILEPVRAGGKKSYRFLRRNIELLAETGFSWP
ncbi:MAG TPA: helix-turn-helix domain-containing protein [Gemmataceae bacterium]